jgi:short-subunit dehydrogenase
MHLKPLREQVLVITGASSGIGLATARAAAKQGARLVLVARNEEALQAIEQEINAAGGQAIHVAGDVGRREDLQRAADAAIAHFGRFDTWVNNAGVSLYGRLTQISDDDHHRLFQTNFWGVVYGSLIAAAHLRRRGGALINIGSVLSDSAVPIQGMYSTSKHAVKGFTDALRMELEADRAPISVTLVKPSAINTPYPQHAKNYLDREASLPPPVYAPEEVAHAILFAATHPKRDIIIGGAGRAMSFANRTFPRVMDRVGETLLLRQQTRPGGTLPHQEGSLHRPGRDGRVHGRYPGHVMRKSYYTRASLHPVLTGTLLLAAGVAAAAVLSRRHGSDPLRQLTLTGGDPVTDYD